MSQTTAPKQALFLLARIARLSPTGAPVVGAENGYSTDATVKIEVSPVVKAGKEIDKENGRGDSCTFFKRPDSILRYDITLEVCDPDPEFTELAAGGFLIRTTAMAPTTGYNAPLLGAVPNPNGISLEGFAQHIDAFGSPDPTLPFRHYAFPRVYLKRDQFTLDSEAAGNTFTGYAIANPSWTTNGPFNDWTGGLPVSAYAWNDVATLPASALGYIPVPTQA